jgi:hypothetical protein
LTRIRQISHRGWAETASDRTASEAAAALERGEVLFLPHLTFIVDRRDDDIFSPAILSSSKNTSFDPATGHVGGTTLGGVSLDRLRALMTRFSDAARSLVSGLLPGYREPLVRARASFRPAEIAGRQTSWRKDDTRLHVDSFPASPVQGRRILRVFTNVNPAGRPRVWRVGGEFEALARRFAPELSLPWPGAGHLLQWLKITKSRRTAYDALMLQLHDRMKADADFQENSEQESIAFPAGSTWLCFTDQVSHAAMSGQYQLEQTFLLPVAAMREERRSPLRLLEQVTGRRLV